MKKIKLLIFSLLIMFLVPLGVRAASGKISVSGASTIVVGNKITLTVTLSGSDIGSWNMNLNYDKSYLQLLSTTSESGGTGMAATSTSGISKKTYTFTFKALKTGSTTVNVNSYEAYQFSDLSEISLTSSGKTVKIITQQELEDSYSKNNDLASLEVEGFTLATEFNKNTLEYNVVVPEDTKEINIIAKASDGKSSISGAGKHEVTSGTNNFDIVVRAENGSEKTYHLTVEVKDANPIEVSVDGNDYTVVKLKENLPGASAYQDSTVKINDIDIPAYYNEFTKLTLVGLKDSLGNISLFIYNEETNTYENYYEIGFNKITIYPLDNDESLDGYTKKEVTVNDVKVNGYVYNDDSRFIVIYGINVETGEKGFYLYDTETQAMVKYNDEYIIDLQDKLNLYSYIIIGFIGFSFVLLLVLLIVITKKKKKRKEQPNVTKVTFLDDEVPEEKDNKEELKKKKNKRKKKEENDQD